MYHLFIVPPLKQGKTEDKHILPNYFSEIFVWIVDIQ